MTTLCVSCPGANAVSEVISRSESGVVDTGHAVCWGEALTADRDEVLRGRGRRLCRATVLCRAAPRIRWPPGVCRPAAAEWRAALAGSGDTPAPAAPMTVDRSRTRKPVTDVGCHGVRGRRAPQPLCPGQDWSHCRPLGQPAQRASSPQSAVSGGYRQLPTGRGRPEQGGDRDGGSADKGATQGPGKQGNTSS